MAYMACARCVLRVSEGFVKRGVLDTHPHGADKRSVLVVAIDGKQVACKETTKIEIARFCTRNLHHKHSSDIGMHSGVGVTIDP
jgi:hypothetical protein